MNTLRVASLRSLSRVALCLALLGLARVDFAQTLLNVDFGAGQASPKAGFAAVGQHTNDFWNPYSHYRPRFQPGMALVPDGRIEGLKFADGSDAAVVVAVTNAPGVWGNATGDGMLDSYVYAPNGSNLVVTVTGLDSGRYHFYLYGWAAADGTREHVSTFRLHSGTNRVGPVAASGAGGWQAGQPWREGVQYVVCRDVPVMASEPVTIEVVPAAGGVAVLNGLQILSRGTGPPALLAPALVLGDAFTNILFRSVAYDGRLGSGSARFAVSIEAESRSTNELAATVFEGRLALLEPKLPPGWRVVRQGGAFVLHTAVPGSNRLDFELVAKVTREEPWDQTEFFGPPAAIATVTAQGADTNLDLQLLSGTAVESGAINPGVVRGVLGADRRVSLRWQSKTAEAAREAVVTAECGASVQLSPAAIRHTTELRYEVLQSRLAQVRVALPAGHTITRLAGEQVRDWRVGESPDGSILTVDFIRPVEDATTLTLTTEQPVPALPGRLELRVPQPLGVQREAGTLRVQAEDLVPRIEASEGLRQVNAAAGDFAAFRFSVRPVSLRLEVARVEPVVVVSGRVRAQLEESRLLVQHDLKLEVSRAGIYALDLEPPAGFLVAEVTGDGIDDWKLADGRLRISLAKRLLGEGRVAVQLEQSLPRLPPEWSLVPLRVTGATRESAFIGAGSTPGIQLKTAAVVGAREIPVNALPERRDELLGFRAETGSWRLDFTAERQTARVVAEVFNLLTIGDGLVGGSATIRFGIVNQGVQQFRLRLPRHWRNVEFTGPNIRRRDQQDDVWTLALQDKVWGGYTLVITYDYPFDPKQATLDAAGAHPLEVERETGTVAITSAASLALEPGPVAEPLRAIDPTELGPTDRALISRPVLRAYRYEGGQFALSLNLTRHEEIAVLDAVADRGQLTSVITGSGEMLTQAGFMVKNNERQHQRFRLPTGATLWGAAVNGEPVKADRDGDWVLVTLPRGDNRDQVFAIDIKYAQQLGALGRLFPRTIRLVAPETDVPGTYVEWMVYVPSSRHVYGFGGNMTVAQGTAYGWRDGWERLTGFYRGLWHDYGAGLIVGGCVVAFFIALFLYGRRRGFQGVVSVVVVFAILAVLAGMMLPALSKAKAKAQRINSVNNLKQIGLAARLYASDNNGKLPNSFEAMISELGTTKVLVDPETGRRYTYVGAGKAEANPDAILAYSPERPGGIHEVVFADGSVQVLTATRFAEALAKDQTAVAGVQQQAAVAQPPPPTLAQTGDAVPAAPGAVPQVQVPAGLPGAPPVAMPVAGGIKSLKFDLPRAGRAYTFTRVLSLSNEPPTVSIGVMSARAFVLGRAALELVAFLVGLALVVGQWRASEPRSSRLAVGVILLVLATVDLLIAWRVLGLALIVAVPGLALIVVSGLAWRWRDRFRRITGQAPPPPPPTLPATPPVAAALVMFGLALPLPAEGAAPAEAPPPPPSIVSAQYTGTAYERAAQLEAVLVLNSSTTNQSVALFGKEVALEEFVATSGEARVWREGDQVGVRLPGPGSAAIRLKLLVKIAGDASRRQLDFPIPPALGSRLALTLPEAEAEIDFPAALSLQRETRGQTTVIEAVLGATDRLTLSWTPRRKRAAELAATAFATQTSLVTLGEGVVNTRATFEWQVTQGELQQVRVRLPAGHRLLKVSGEHLRGWDFVDTNRDVLNLELLKPVAPSVRLSLETERPLEVLPARVTLALPEALEVKRQTGLVAVRAADDLGLTLERTAGLERIESAEFPGQGGEATPALFSAWRFLRPDFELRLKADLLQPRLEAVQRQQFTVGAEQLGLRLQGDYTISRAGVFALRLVLPPAGRVEAVQCAAMQTWTEHVEAGRRLLEVALKQRTLGPLALEVQLDHSYTNLPATLALEGLHPLGVEKLTTYVTVAAEAGVGLKTGALEGVTEIPAATVPGAAAASAGTLAFKYIATEPQPAAAWRVNLSTEQLDSWVRAEIVHFITVGESLVSGRSLVRYEIQNAPVREFRLRVPDAWRNVEIVGAGVRRRDHTDGAWRVELQNKVSGEYRLSVHWDMARGASNRLELAGLETLGTERETGAVGLLTSTQLQLVPGSLDDRLLRVDPRELPEWAAAQAGGASGLSFRYLRPGWRLPLEVRRFEDAAVLQALVDSVRLRTVIADDGQHMTQIELSIRNNGRQSLALNLPPRSQVWSAFVDGRPIRPARRGETLLLPLEGSEDAEAAIPVEVTYVGTVRFPRSSGRVELVSPRVDLPLKDARWEVFLPPDHAYSRFKGSMTFESAALVPVSQDFTLAEYQRQEISKQESFTAQAVDFLRRSRSEVATGNLASATKLKGFKGAQLRDQGAADELRKLEADVNRAQSSQLIEAQQAYTFSNAARYADAGVEAGGAFDQRLLRRYGLLPSRDAGRPAEPEAVVNYDAKVAEQQVAQLQKAQAVAEAVVTPLRANLPTRGFRYSFVQVLQTEPDKPLVVRFHANNQREVGWFRRLLWVVGGFLAVWFAAAVTLGLRPRGPAGSPGGGESRRTPPDYPRPGT